MILRDQIYGDITFSDSEARIVNSRSFNRLRYIKQLGFVEFDYPCATHTRYQHSIGVCENVTRMYNSVCRAYPEFYRETDLPLLRAMALCHDLGHAPFSHASEELSHISHEERLEEILEYEKKNIIFPSDYDIPAWELVYQVYVGEGLTYLSDSHLVALHGFLDGFIDADKIDYLERDARNCGVFYGNFDRDALINNLTLTKNKIGVEEIAIKQAGVQALESFLLARYYMFSQIYMSPKERLFRVLYCNEMKELLPDGMFPRDVRKFLQLDDTKYIRRLKCINTMPYGLVYDGEFNLNIKNLLDRKLKGYLMCDTPRKTIFRRDTDDSTVMVVDDILGRVIPCSEASPILRNIEYTNIHKLRYYADIDKVNELRQEVRNVLKAGGF